MNNKGQMASVGMLIALFVGIVVVMSLLSGAILPSIGTMTNTLSVTNKTYSSVANGSYITLDGVEVVGSVTAFNATAGNGTLIAAGNYSVTTREVVDGVLVSRLQIINPRFASTNASSWNLSYTYEPSTYDNNSGGRTMAGLIAIFAALGVAVFAISPTLREKLFDLF